MSLCANEGLGSEQDVLRILEGEVADVLCFSSIWVGTLRRFSMLSQIAHLQGILICKHTHGELGVAAAAAHHIMLTLPNVIDGCQQTAAIMADDILTEDIPIGHGPRWGKIGRLALGLRLTRKSFGTSAKFISATANSFRMHSAMRGRCGRSLIGCSCAPGYLRLTGRRAG